MNKKRKNNGWKLSSQFVFRGKVFEKGSWGLLQKVSLFITLLPLPQVETPPKTLRAGI